VTRTTASAEAAARWLSSHGAGRPALAVVFGSGLAGSLVPAPLALEADYETIPGFAGTSVPGHPGRLRAGRVEGIEVLLFEGRRHSYEGVPEGEMGVPLQAAFLLGARAALVTSSCGALDFRSRPGDFVVVRDHLVYPLGGPATALGRPEGAAPGGERPGGVEEGSPRPGPAAEEAAGARGRLYSPRLSRALERACLAAGCSWRRGVLAFSCGPCYETRAESRALRAAGADVVSMSAAREAKAAAAVGLEVACLCCVTNVVRLSAPRALDHGEVVAAAGEAARTLASVVRAFAREMTHGGLAG